MVRESATRYTPTMSGHRRHPWRFLLTGVAAIAAWYVVGILWTIGVNLLLADDGDFVSGSELYNPLEIDVEHVILIWLPAGVIVFGQLLLIAPVARPVTVSGAPRNAWPTLILSGLLAASLVGGFLFLLYEVPRLLVVADLVGGGTPEQLESRAERQSSQLQERTYLVLLAIVLAAWIGWTWLLLRSMRRSRADFLNRAVNWLLVGTLIELAIALPLHLLLRRRFSCWCALPSAWAVVLALVALFTLTGPGVLLLWRRRAGLPSSAVVNRCFVCSYTRSETAGPRCPECGTRWGRMVAENSD